MKYKVTKHYLKGKEALIAAFFDLNDAKIFINQKIRDDERNKINVLYRIYDHLELVNEFHNGTPSFSEPEDPETYSRAEFIFKLKVQGVNSLERTTVAYFNEKEDAHLFVMGKCSNGDKGEILDTFMIFRDKVLITTLTQNILDNKALQDLRSSSSAKGATLSPLPTRPTPPGGPGDYWKERSDDDE